MKSARPSANGFKHFFSPLPLESENFNVRGIGIRESMPPCQIERPRGTGDYLIMWFHDPVWIGAAERADQFLPANHVIIWTPKKRQFYGHPGEHFRHTWIHCEGTQVRRLIATSKLPLNQPIPFGDSAQFEQDVENLYRELTNYLNPDALIASHLLDICLRNLARANRRAERTRRVPENLLRVRNFIQSAPARKITLAEMAEMAGMSPPHFCARFKAFFRMSPGDCLIRHRLNLAAHLLLDHNLRIAEIAAQVGYDDPFHFSKMFRKQFGRSPRAVREADSGRE